MSDSVKSTPRFGHGVAEARSELFFRSGEQPLHSGNRTVGASGKGTDGLLPQVAVQDSTALSFRKIVDLASDQRLRFFQYQHGFRQAFVSDADIRVNRAMLAATSHAAAFETSMFVGSQIGCDCENPR